MKRRKLAMHCLWAAWLTIFAPSITPSFAQYPSILDANDADAKQALFATTATALLSNKRYAESWLVLSSVALGMGTEKCHFPPSDDMGFMWQPALTSLSEDEILTLNRVVTSNFRNAERNGRLLLDRLFPVTRQAVLMLSNGRGNWDCAKVAEVWTAARNYMKVKSDSSDHHNGKTPASNPQPPRAPDTKADMQPHDCDENLFQANAIFIRAATFCAKNYMDTRAGYYALAGARKCASAMTEAEITPKTAKVMKLLDSTVELKGKSFACRWVDGIEKSILQSIAN